MATVSGRIFISTAEGIVYIEVPERAVAGLLRDEHFTPGKHTGGVIGTYRGIPVTMRPVQKRG